MKPTAAKERDWKSSVEEGVAYMKAQTLTIMSEMGIGVKDCASWKDVPTAVRQFSKRNKTPLMFARNLDSATYELRERLRWNTRMASKLALEKAKQKNPWRKKLKL